MRIPADLRVMLFNLLGNENTARWWENCLGIFSLDIADVRAKVTCGIVVNTLTNRSWRTLDRSSTVAGARSPITAHGRLRDLFWTSWSALTRVATRWRGERIIKAS